jgi:hypothetical protein
MATIDSPSAMIRIKLKRSAKCPAEIWKPRTPNTNGPARSMARAAIHNAACVPPSKKLATIRRAGPGMAVRARRRMAIPVLTSLLASAKRKMCIQRASA